MAAIIEGYYEQEKDRQFNISAHLIRDLIFSMIAGNPYIKKDDKPTMLSEIMEFPGDRLKEIKEFTKEEIERMRKAWKM